MACEGCKFPMHDQFEGHPGRWYCFHLGPKHGCVICETPVEDHRDIAAHNKILDNAKTPKWCPLKKGENE